MFKGTSVALTLFLLSPIGLAQASPRPPGFVTAGGTHFLLNGAHYPLVGFNMGLGGCTTYSLAQDESQLAEVTRNAHATVARVWFFQSKGGPGNWSDFDNVVQAATDQGITLIVSLGNNWGNCEADGHQGEKYLPWYQSGYAQTGDGYPLSYRAWVQAITAHLAAAPAIAVWQLMNEPDGRNAGGSCDEGAAAGALTAFAHDMVQVIRAVDPNHLIDLGAVSWCGGQGTDTRLLDASGVTACDVTHDYGGSGVQNPASIAACAAAGMPGFVGEIGLGGPSLTARADAYAGKLEAYRAAGVDGFVIWHKEGDGAPRSAGDWQVGTGDPTEAMLANALQSMTGTVQAPRGPAVLVAPAATATSVPVQTPVAPSSTPRPILVSTATPVAWPTPIPNQH